MSEPSSNPPNRARWGELISLHLLATISEDDAIELEAALASSHEAREDYRQRCNVDAALRQESAGQLMPTCVTATRLARWLTWRPLIAAAAGLVIGLVSASIVWAISAPRVSAERLFSLQNGSFDEKRLERGFPKQAGIWGGDEAEITNDGRLSFISPGGDSNTPGGRAIACDLFQLVDLRPLRHLPQQQGDAVLELSANFLDARPPNTNPSVTFFCQLYMFQGDPAALHETWSQSITDTIASGSAQVTTLGSRSSDWTALNAKCLVPAEADFAVIQIAARPNLRPAKLQSLFADEVKFTLKTSPELPIRIVQR